jgi:metal-responsive CopG/Arc/MetJ family transcriptional regulator
MVNQMINLRMENKLISELDQVVKESTFSSRSEFIKDAVRKAVIEFHKMKALETLVKYKGYGKRTGKEISDKAFEDAKQAVEKSFFS